MKKGVEKQISPDIASFNAVGRYNKQIYETTFTLIRDFFKMARSRNKWFFSEKIWKNGKKNLLDMDNTILHLIFLLNIFIFEELLEHTLMSLINVGLQINVGSGKNIKT